MDDMQSQMGAILNNPEMMQKIMAMAQSLQGGQQEPSPVPKEAPPAMPNIDIGMLQKLSGIAGQSGIDSNQKNLLQALGPYINHSRISRLERAMRAARMAGIATTLLPQLTQGR